MRVHAWLWAGAAPLAVTLAMLHGVPVAVMRVAVAMVTTLQQPAVSVPTGRSAERVWHAPTLRNRAAAIRRAIPHGLAQVMSSSGPLRGYPGCYRRHLGTGLSTISASTVRNPVRSSRPIAQWAALATHAPNIASAYPRHRLHLAFRPCSTSLPGSARPVPSWAGGGSRRARSPRLHRSWRGRVALDAITN